MIPVQAFMPSALAAIIRQAPLSPEKIAFAWRTAVGPSVDRVTTITLDGHLLRVRTPSAAWRREVERSAGLIRARLAPLLGEDIVRSLDVTIDGQA